MQCKKGWRNEGSGFIVQHHYKGTNNNFDIQDFYYERNHVLFDRLKKQSEFRCTLFHNLVTGGQKKNQL